MISPACVDFCERLWTDWLSERVRLPAHVSRRFQLDHAPEPYLRFGNGNGRKPLYLLWTNPGAGMPHQLRNAVKESNGPIRAEMKYYEAALALGDFYLDSAKSRLKGGARRRNDAMVDLQHRVGADCTIVFESIPFHSRSLPGKATLPNLIRGTELLHDYEAVLKMALSNVSLVAVSAVDSCRSISADSIRRSEWLMWQVSLLGIDPRKVGVEVLATKGDTVSRAFLYQEVAGHVRGIVLMMGSNSLPGTDGRSVLARTLRSSDNGLAYSHESLRLEAEYIAENRMTIVALRAKESI
jgi:hypothetical protein